MSEKNANRVRIVSMRLSIEEYDKMEAKFKTTTCRKLSEYMRNVLLEKKITVFTRNKSMDDFMAELIRLRSELNGVGNNFNQVVKKLHLLPSSTELKVWIMVNETTMECVVKKIDEIKLSINKFSDRWSQG
jgi:hypothetical protein